MEYLIGVLLALGTGVFATAVGFDRERGFYPVVLCVIASYYALFAIMGGSLGVLTIETGIAGAFLALAAWGFKRNLWLVVAGLFGHGALDLIHPQLLANPGEPAWWPMFCMAFDMVAAGYLALKLLPAGSPAVEAELSAAQACLRAGRALTAFHHLERAHVLGQASTLEHVRVHIRMLGWSLREGDAREALGQAFRIAGAASMTCLGLVPRGNTGGSNVSAFRSMPVPPDLATLIAASPRRDLRGSIAGALRAGVTFGRTGSGGRTENGLSEGRP
ncbi:MAG TPA: DUF3703 domain-containing protein [Phenylobacterium sp.]|nr:DUF3703 domain-containing protein [Phenylobacterium sp.]